jgi:hypothetical protein
LPKKARGQRGGLGSGMIKIDKGPTLLTTLRTMKLLLELRVKPYGIIGLANDLDTLGFSANASEYLVRTRRHPLDRIWQGPILRGWTWGRQLGNVGISSDSNHN